MAYQEILHEKRSQTLWIYLNRPKDMNAITSTILVEMEDLLTKTRDDDEVRVIVLTGNGPAFCAGADLKGVVEIISKEPGPAPDFFEYVARTFDLLNHYPKPVIAALNGLTLAGGLELAMTADIVVAAESAKIGDAHSNFGVLPGAGGAVRLPRKIGVNAAKYLLFTGDFISAEEMRQLGFVNKVVPDAELVSTVQKLADRLSEKSPLVLRRMKETVHKGIEQPLDMALRYEGLVLRQHLRSYDLSEGITAFAGKRKPQFKGY